MMKKSYEIEEISPQTLKTWLDRREEIVLIDPMPMEQYIQSRLPGAKNACVYEVTFLDQVEAIVADRNAEIVLCGVGVSSKDAQVAAEKLLRAEYLKVYVLKGGQAAWRDAGYPLEGENPGGDEETYLVPPVENQTFRVDPDQSVIEWTGRNPNGKHMGTVSLSGGEIIVKDGIIGGNFQIDMKSIKNTDLEGDPLQPVLIDHLMSDDFFFVKLFPKAKFKIISALPVEKPTQSAPNFEIHGILELRGVQADLKFAATVNPIAEGGLSAEAHFDMDRTRWNVIYGSSRFFKHLGMHLVFDPITIQLRIVAH